MQNHSRSWLAHPPPPALVPPVLPSLQLHRCCADLISAVGLPHLFFALLTSDPASKAAWDGGQALGGPRNRHCYDPRRASCTSDPRAMLLMRSPSDHSTGASSWAAPQRVASAGGAAAARDGFAIARKSNLSVVCSGQDCSGISGTSLLGAV